MSNNDGKDSSKKDTTTISLAVDTKEKLEEFKVDSFDEVINGLLEENKK